MGEGIVDERGASVADETPGETPGWTVYIRRELAAQFDGNQSAMARWISEHGVPGFDQRNLNKWIMGTNRGVPDDRKAAIIKALGTPLREALDLIYDVEGLGEGRVPPPPPADSPQARREARRRGETPPDRPSDRVPAVTGAGRDRDVEELLAELADRLRKAPAAPEVVELPHLPDGIRVLLSQADAQDPAVRDSIYRALGGLLTALIPTDDHRK